MANMFRDAAGKKAVTPHKKPEEAEPVRIAEKPEETEKKPETAGKKTAKKTSAGKQESGAAIRPETKSKIEKIINKQSKGKTYSIYLDEDVNRAVDALAEENNTSKSKIINMLLRNMLFE